MTDPSTVDLDALIAEMSLGAASKVVTIVARETPAYALEVKQGAEPEAEVEPDPEAEPEAEPELEAEPEQKLDLDADLGTDSEDDVVLAKHPVDANGNFLLAPDIALDDDDEALDDAVAELEDAFAKSKDAAPAYEEAAPKYESPPENKVVPATPDAASQPRPVTPLITLFKARNIRIMGTVEFPVFVATDVAKYIDDAHNSNIFHKTMPEKFLIWGEACTGKGIMRKVRFLNEHGLYKYLLQSKKKLAESFQLFTYNLLVVERKRTVNAKRLALKIEKAQRRALQIENSINVAKRRDRQIEINDVMRVANIAREQERRAAKELELLIREEEGEVPEDDEYDEGDEYDEDDEYDEIIDEEPRVQRNQAPSRPLPIPEEPSDGTSEAEVMTPLIEIFEEKKIRIIGTVEEPLFCAADVAVHIRDINGDRIFREQTPGVYVHWDNTDDGKGRKQLTRFLTEPGLYRYLLQTNLKRAEAFQEYTYELLTEERKRTVDSIELATKIEQTKIEELKRAKRTASILQAKEQEELAHCLYVANSAREKLKETRKQLEERIVAREKDAIQHYWAPWSPPASW